MQRRRSIFFFSIIAVFAVSMLAGASGVQAKAIQISFMHYFPAKHFVHTKVAEPWTRIVEKESNGKVKFTLYPAAALAKPPDFFDAAVAGSVDIIIGYSGYTPGRFPVSDVFGLPFMGYTSTMCATKTFNELWSTVPEIEKEWRALKILWFGSSAPTQLHTKKRAVKRLDDMKGLKIKIGGKTAPYLKALGATPLSMSSPEVYDALAKGVIDGTIYPWEAIHGWKLGDQVYYHTWLNLYAEPFYVAMNRDKWKSLPPDIQKLIEKYGGNYGMQLWAREWDIGNNEALDWLKNDPKHAVITMPASELERAIELERPHYDKWFKDMKQKGINGPALLNKVRGLAKKYAD